MNNSKEADNLLPSNYDSNGSYVYMLWDNEVVVYVGKSNNVKSRVQSHLIDKKFDSVGLILCKNSEIDRIESHKINMLKPKYNKKDNPNYKKVCKNLDETNKELSNIVQNAAEDAGINGVMKLAKLVKDKTGLSYERVSRVWGGSRNAKFCDVEDILEVLEVKIHWKSKGDKS